MDFKDLLLRRYSCRSYVDRPVEREKLEACVEAARLSPSACNSQRWAFVAVDDPEQLDKLAGALRDEEMGVNTHAGKTPAFIVVVKQPMEESTPFQNRMLDGGKCWDIDIGIAAQTLCLAATHMGLGTVMMTRFRAEEVHRILCLPQQMQPAVVIGVGYPVRETWPSKSRRPLPQILHWNRVCQPTAER